MSKKADPSYIDRDYDRQDLILARDEIKKLKSRLALAEEELKLAREHLCPAGWKLLQRGALAERKLAVAVKALDKLAHGVNWDVYVRADTLAALVEIAEMDEGAVK